MAQPTISDVQPVEPILTDMLVAYMQADTRFVASKVFPLVNVDKDSGTYFAFDKKYWFIDDMQARAPGAPFATTDFTVSTGTYTTLQCALEYAIADEIRANSQVPMDLETAAVRLLAQRSLIRKERAFSADFMKVGVWGTDDNNSGTDWDDFSNSDPIYAIAEARRTISANTGLDGNSMVVGYIVHTALLNHPDILDRVKYVSAAMEGNIEGALAAVFGLSNYWVGKASYDATNEAASFAATAIIDDDALVCHVDPGAGVFGATAGKTFVWGGGGGAGSLYRVRNDFRHADIIQHKEQWDQVAVATDLGYFFADIV